MGLKLGFGVLQGILSTSKTGNGFDLQIWFSLFFFPAEENTIMHI